MLGLAALELFFFLSFLGVKSRLSHSGPGKLPRTAGRLWNTESEDPIELRRSCDVVVATRRFLEFSANKMGTSPWVCRDPVARVSLELKLFRRHKPGKAGDWNYDDFF